ncbi:MAG: Deoxycytidine triphosphate deaminase [Parcubacteria group bacterium GW2011_GWC2_45_7]|nr:MAG: Deoxycytidine triphosphate deaminase [Parcubacteria group bacterium GW2011_GWC2_45_7]KKU73823.1 MAG: Deoxycytidine triphosphate deaminase [Parcubacteria group bacterium GW2011_GWA2_47_26]
MILSDRDIKRAITDGRIKVDPLPDFSNTLGPCSLDFRLGNELRIFEYTKHPVIDPAQKELFDKISRPINIPDGENFIIHPGELIIASTTEWLELSDSLIGRLEGRSSLGRIGVVVHSTAARFDPGWRGRPVLELGNLGRIPVALKPGMRICSFTFEELSSPAEVVYHKKLGAKYVNQDKPEASRLADEL